MGIVTTRAWTCAALLVLLACGRSEDETIVASVGDETISIEEVVAYMQEVGYGTNLADVRRAVDDMVDMRLVAERAFERHEPTPLEGLQLKELEENLIWNQFREDVVWGEIQVDEERLREWYDANVDEEVSARHILLSARSSDPDSVREAARARADSLLAEVKGGADFEQLARVHSEDPGSAERGGSLGYFQRGQMVPKFERAAFGTPVGEIAPELVETQFGYHIIKVEDKRKKPFEELREEIEDQLAAPERNAAERSYITGLMENSGIEFLEENVDLLIAIVNETPPRIPSGEERELLLASYNEGQISLGEIWDLYDILPEANQRQIAELDQAGMIQALSQQVQRRLALARAREGETVLDTTRQRQLEDRRRQLYAQAYLMDVMRSRLVIADSTVRRYYDEHLEFYQDQEFEEVREQIREILMDQRSNEMTGTDAQRELVSAVADSQEDAVSIVRHTDRFERVLEALGEERQESDQPL